MGGACSGRAALRDSDEDIKRVNCFSKPSKDHHSFTTSSDDSDSDIFNEKNPRKFDCIDMLLCSPFEPRTSKQDKTLVKNKVPQTSMHSNKIGIDDREKPPGVSETNNMYLLRSSSTFVSGSSSSRGSEISILAFEVASTVTKGATILRALSTENLNFLKERVLLSDGVQRLVSSNMEELLRIASSDKRKDFDHFSREVVRFGKLCKDSQWHNLDLYFQKLRSDVNFIYKGSKEDAEMTMEELVPLAQNTSELYHELHALDRFERDYWRKLEEVESLQLLGKGDSITLLNHEFNRQRKLVRSLKKRSLWTKNLDEVVEKLVEVVKLIHQELSEAFDNDVTGNESVDPHNCPERLGTSGLALHYANIVNQIEKIMCVVSRPYSLQPNARDTLYHGLPSSVKAGLRSQLQTTQSQELTELQIRAEMEKTLQWLVPLAANTAKAHQGFGTVGEWANACKTLNVTSSQSNYIRLQTLYHADKNKTESYILELVAWLHCLMSQVRQKYYGLKTSVPIRPLKRKKNLVLDLEIHQEPFKPQPSGTKNNIAQLPEMDIDIVDEVSSRRSNPVCSKTQELSLGKKKNDTIEQLTLSKRVASSISIREELSISSPKLANTITTNNQFDETTTH